MQHTISISQTAIYTNFPTLDLKDAAIIDFICKFTAKPIIKTKIEDGRVFYWIQYQNLVAQNPLLKIKEQCLRKRIAHMCDLKIFEAHPNNQSCGQTFFAYGERSEEVHFSKDGNGVGKFIPSNSEADGTDIPTTTVKKYQRVGKNIPTEQGYNNNSKETQDNSSSKDENFEVSKTENPEPSESEPRPFGDPKPVSSKPKKPLSTFSGGAGGFGRGAKLLTYPELARKVASAMAKNGWAGDRQDTIDRLEEWLPGNFNITANPNCPEYALSKVWGNIKDIFPRQQKAPQNANETAKKDAMPGVISEAAKKIGALFGGALLGGNWAKIETRVSEGYTFEEAERAYLDTPDGYDPFNWAMSEHGLMSARRKLARPSAAPAQGAESFEANYERAYQPMTAERYADLTRQRKPNNHLERISAIDAAARLKRQQFEVEREKRKEAERRARALAARTPEQVADHEEILQIENSIRENERATD